MGKGKNTKSHFVYVTPKSDPFDVIERKMFFDANGKNEWLKTAQEQYPPDEYKIWHEYR